MNRYVVILSACLLWTLSLSAQRVVAPENHARPDTMRMYRVELLDGSVFVGRMVDSTDTRIRLLTNSGTSVDVDSRSMTRITPVSASELHQGKYWFPNPNATRYLFAPSAFSLKRGEGYYQNTYIVLNSFNVGVTDNITIGGGFELTSLLIKGSGGPIFFLTPKVSIPVNDRFRAAAGVLYVNVPDLFSNQRSGGGIAYGVGTFGTPNSNFSAGLGWGFIQGDFSTNPVVTLSGMHRVSRKVALVTENWLIPAEGYYGIYSYGVRFFGEKIAVDLAFLNNRDIASVLVLGVPYIDFVVKF